jgi:hypothetical protein
MNSVSGKREPKHIGHSSWIGLERVAKASRHAGKTSNSRIEKGARMSSEEVKFIISAIESGDFDLALNLARSALVTTDKGGDVREVISDYPVSESILNYNGP